MIDPGHGGIDSGTVSDGVAEKFLTLAIALKLKPGLENLGATVIMTRANDTNVPLDEIVRLTNSRKPDIFVSIHVNHSSDPKVDGIETFYFTPQSQPLADALFHKLVSDLPETGHFVHRRDLRVVCRTSIPATLVEVGYLSNLSKRQRLVHADYQQKIADALAKGIVDYFAP